MSFPGKRNPYLHTRHHHVSAAHMTAWGIAQDAGKILEHLAHRDIRDDPAAERVHAIAKDVATRAIDLRDALADLDKGDPNP